MIDTIVSRLRMGVPQNELRNPLSPASLPAYYAMIAAAISAITSLALLGISTELMAFSTLSVPAWWLVGGILAKRVGHRRIGTFAEAIGIVGCASFAFMLLQMSLTVISLQDADAALISADRTIGFDWKTAADALQQHQALVMYLTAIYRSIVWQPPIIIALLCYTNRVDRVWLFVFAWLASLAVVMTIYPFLPAQGGFIYYHYQPDAWPGRLSDEPWHFGPIIHALRDGGIRQLRAEDMTGLVSFPSFHVAAAVLLAWAAWPLRVIGPLALALNIGMSLAAIICGPHYLIDVIGGAAIGLLAISLAKILLISKRSSADDGHSEV